MTARIAPLVLASCLGLTLMAPASPAQSAPLAVSLKACKVSVHSIAYVIRVDGVDGNYVQPENTEMFRLALVTIRIDKLPGHEVTLAACDLSLHYRHGSESEATICEGISTFSLHPDDKRPMSLPKMAGPGFVKQTTSVECDQAKTVYIDAVFAGIEPDVGDVWLCLAQPVSTAPVSTEGWKP